MDDVVASDFTGTRDATLAMDATLTMAARFNTQRFTGQQLGQQLGATMSEPASQPVTTSTPATSGSTTTSLPPTGGGSGFGSTVTAELPTYHERNYWSFPEPSQQRYSSQVRHETDQRASKQRRPSTPLVLRLGVFFLALVFLASLIGYGALQSHPSWFSALRAVPPAVTLGNKITTVNGNRISLVAASKDTSGPIYRVPTDRYAISITVAKPVWLSIDTPPNAAKPSVAEMLGPSTNSQQIPLTGDAEVTVAAQATSITVYSGTKNLGTIPAPKVGTPYTFETPTQ